MYTLRIRTDLTPSDLRRLLRHGYEILAIETDHAAERHQHMTLWARSSGLVIPEHELPF